MKVLITGSAGLVGSAAVKRYAEEGNEVFGVDNNLRAYFFGKDGSTEPTLNVLKKKYDNYEHIHLDLRLQGDVYAQVKRIQPDIIFHAAAQPSHDWAAKQPFTDFNVNAVATLNLLEAARRICPKSPFCHVSTSKVYGDNPNRLDLKENLTRLDLPKDHKYYNGIDTSMSIDQCLHSLFGVSKASGDLLVQEYGKYFDMPTLSLRPGCITGPKHAGVELHGFLSYLMKCVANEIPYKIIGYGGLQVRCNIHADDLVDAYHHFTDDPLVCGAAVNIGGGRKSACSILEALHMAETITNKKAIIEHVDEPRIGDHKWWISDNSEFQSIYPAWEPKWEVSKILMDIYNEL